MVRIPLAGGPPPPETTGVKLLKEIVATPLVKEICAQEYMGFPASVMLPPLLRNSTGKVPVPVKLPPWAEPFQV
jgi:hypothetical protein